MYCLITLTQRERVRRAMLRGMLRRRWYKVLLLVWWFKRVACALKEPKLAGNQARPLLKGQYTPNVPPTLGGGGPSGSWQGPEFRRVEGGGSWTEHNPACDDLPYAPRWGLIQGSRMDDLGNCREFYSRSLPPSERLFQKNHHRLDLLDDHIHSGVNFFSITQEIVRDWQSMGEDIMEFETAKKEFAAERDAFNSEKKGLLWRVADSEDKLAKEKQFIANHQKDWEVACERSNRDLKYARDEVVKLKAEKAKDNQEYEHLAVAHKEKEAESQTRIATLEKTVEEQLTQNKALELLAEDLGAAYKWLLARGIPLSDELAKYMFELGGAAYDCGRKDGYGEGKAAAFAKDKYYQFELYKVDCTANYTAKRQEYEFLKFGIIKVIEKLTRKGIAVETLKKVLEDTDAETAGAGPSHQVIVFNQTGCALDRDESWMFTMFVLSLCQRFFHVCLKCYEVVVDRLLCYIDPAVHLVVKRLGGLQCLHCLVYDSFVCKWVRNEGWLTGFIVCNQPGCALGRDEPWRSTMFSAVKPTMFLCAPEGMYAFVTKIHKR
ncbi:hypothetical protein Hdeb2414_s0008g00297531 [Helianthus debilis subsp. tardiflorus]